MILQALLVSKDDATAETLTQVLAQFDVIVDRRNASEIAMARLTEERFDEVIVDFDDPETATLLLEGCRRLAGPDRTPPVTVALLHDASQIRSILGAGAHFILTKPISAQQAHNALRAATALLQRERRHSLRVAVQAAISLRIDEDKTIEGILLDLSMGGMDVLAAKPIPSGTVVRVSFELPDVPPALETNAEVAWSSTNGQIGLRFIDMEAGVHEKMGQWLAARSHDLLSQQPEAVSECQLTDLSLGGCYVRTESPFPQSSTVDLCLRAADMEIHAEGFVQVMHPGHGMGIEFAARTEEQRQSVGRFIEFLASQPGITPQLEASPRSLVADAANLCQTGPGSNHDDPLLELLRTGQALDQDAFLAEMQRQRTPAAVSQ
ncbi:MAG: PilZ domain-containing protein [Terriglobales bacterium]|jgi:CheY-like chemotaxis protein